MKIFQICLDIQEEGIPELEDILVEVTLELEDILEEVTPELEVLNLR